MGARDTSPATTFVTVVFEPEIRLLELQALSIARFLDPSYAARIIVIDNSARGMPKRAWSRLRGLYGPLQDTVELIRADRLSSNVEAAGWFSQQVVKLSVARIVETPTYLTLDSKNHFVRAAGARDFEAADGRARGNFHGYETHPLRQRLERVLAYVGLEPEDYVTRFGATATPFTLYTERVRSLIEDVESSTGKPFATEFISAGLTEYFLYSAWLISKGERLDELYDPSGVLCPAIWPRGANIAGVSRAVAEVRDRDPALFSVHRTALWKMDRASVGILAALWTERGLFDSGAEARAFVRSYRARYFPAMALKKLRERRAPGSRTAG